MNTLPVLKSLTVPLWEIVGLANKQNFHMKKSFTEEDCCAMAQRVVDAYWESELDDIDETYEEPDPNPFTFGTQQWQWFADAYEKAMEEAMELN